MNFPTINLCSFHTIITISCCVGCLVQVNYVINRYLSFDTVTIIKISRPKFTMLPDIVFCFDIISIINKTKANNLYPQLKESVNKLQPFTNNLKPSINSNQTRETSLHSTLYNLITKRLTINQITNILYEPEEIFTDILLHRSIRKKPEPCEFRKCYREGKFCIVLACSTKTTNEVHYTINDLYPGFQSLIYLHFNEKIISLQRYIKVAFIEPNTLPHDRRIKWKSLKIEGGKNIHITSYYSYISNLTPPPYTNCVNYSSQGYVNRAHKLNECVVNRSIRRFSKVLHSSLVIPDLNVTFAAFDKSSVTDLTIFETIISTCERSVQNFDCETNLYVIYNRAPIRAFDNTTRFLIETSTHPMIKLILKPKYTIQDCIVLIGGILGFWFGFAINVHVPKGLKLIISKLKDLRKRKSKFYFHKSAFCQNNHH